MYIYNLLAVLNAPQDGTGVIFAFYQAIIVRKSKKRMKTKRRTKRRKKGKRRRRRTLPCSTASMKCVVYDDGAANYEISLQVRVVYDDGANYQSSLQVQ